MKKLLAFAMAALLLLSLAGCSKPEEEPGEFDYIVRLLEDEDYEEVLEEVYDLMGKEFEGFDEEDEDEDDRDNEEEVQLERPKDEQPAEAPEAAVEEAPVEEIAPVVEEIAPDSAVVELTPIEGELLQEYPAIEAIPIGDSAKLLIEMPVTIVDNLGNEDTDNLCYYERNEQGLITFISGHDAAISYGFYLHTFADYLKLTYTEDGKIETAKVTDSWDEVNALGTPSYDESGNMVGMHIVTNTAEFDLTFDYDEAGRCIRADIFDTFWEEISFVIYYTYDAEGRLLQEHWDMVGFGNTGRTVDYTYDESGRLLQSYTTWHTSEPWHETAIYTLDEYGNPISAEITSDTTSSGYSLKTVQYVYETYPVIP